MDRGGMCNKCFLKVLFTGVGEGEVVLVCEVLCGSARSVLFQKVRFSYRLSSNNRSFSLLPLW